MAPAKFERILSVSSEDPAFPAENLLKKDYSNKKWKCKKPGEKQITVVIQLEKSESITAVDVGNYGSAFIEILVGKSSSPDEYKVLVVTSSLMSLQDSKLGNNLSSVRFFKEDSLVKEVLSEKWDRIKVVCSQPYNKILQYGLAFLVVHTATVPSEREVPVLGNFQLKNKENSDSLSIGSLFAKRKQIPSNEVSGASAIRIASTTGILGKRTSLAPPSSSELNRTNGSDEKDQLTVLRKKSPEHKKKPRSSSPNLHGKNTFDISSTSDSPLTNGSITKVRSRDESKVKPSYSSKKPAPPPRLTKPFNKLFEGVIFAISGFQNPYRSELRSKALQMGAKYRPDWDSTCTHLLCAFPNTPKFDQVLGHGKIVTKFWVENSYERRMRLPWRRYALHPPDKNLPESEEEIFEFVERPPSPLDNRRRISHESSSGPDTEEEIERVLERQRSLAVGNEENTTKDNKDNVNYNNEKSPGDDDRTNQPSSAIEEKQDNKEIKPCIVMKNDSPEIRKNKKFAVSKRSALDDKRKMSPVSKKKRKASTSENVQLDDIYNMDTEEEDESWDSKVFNLPHLPEIFKGKNFFICSDIEEEFSKLCRYILAHKGGLIKEDDLSSKEVNYLIANTIDEVEKVKIVQPNVVPVRPEWIWKAHDEGRIPPSTSFEITHQFD